MPGVVIVIPLAFLVRALAGEFMRSHAVARTPRAYGPETRPRQVAAFSLLPKVSRHRTWQQAHRDAAFPMIMSSVKDALQTRAGGPENNDDIISFSFSAVVPSSSNDTYDAFIDYVWVGGGGLPIPPPVILSRGTSAGVGLERMIVPPFLREKIISAELGRRITYTVVNPSVLTYPVTDHLGNIWLSEEGDNATRIEWNVTAKPMRGWGWYVRPFTALIISTLLKKFEAHCSTIGLTPA
eukprot:gnl/TRDRNA2_/TRDRNA2_201159_c0_seq1.p1 gnl/TRDRNA2_/TRDRNA2_201159_c0~~gnl/TRDRNA2_/TRDRNA2_201159_c0_seq1.p1  ORF type:complete len:239 (+),score=19.02 gnl/TRDRNA2_/TRDRNA2_201159_c0_seq1:78-794(+)